MVPEPLLQWRARSKMPLWRSWCSLRERVFCSVSIVFFVTCIVAAKIWVAVGHPSPAVTELLRCLVLGCTAVIATVAVSASLAWMAAISRWLVPVHYRLSVEGLHDGGNTLVWEEIESWGIEPSTEVRPRRLVLLRAKLPPVRMSLPDDNSAEQVLEVLRSRGIPEVQPDAWRTQNPRIEIMPDWMAGLLTLVQMLIGGLAGWIVSDWRLSVEAFGLLAFAYWCFGPGWWIVFLYYRKSLFHRSHQEIWLIALASNFLGFFAAVLGLALMRAGII